MLNQTTKKLLHATKNLLAFSGGSDSTALLFLLLENNIPFDIAIVDYGLREQSQKEVAYAKELAAKYGFECFVAIAPEFKRNFEANARAFRYNFFESLIASRNYTTLLTAHHLGDKLEWFLMQFCKGAGCVELSGLREIEEREDYKLIRPLLTLEKSTLINYCQNKNIKYFTDESNSDERYKRNYFRSNFARPLLEKYASGIAKSFEYLEQDSSALIQKTELKKCNQLAYFSSMNKRSDIYHIDKYLKSIGHIITAKERELLMQKEELVVGRKYAIAWQKGYVFIAPYLHATSFTKEFKEKMRRLGIVPKLRSYLAEDLEAVELLSLLLQ